MNITYRRFVEDFYLFMEVIRAYLTDNVKGMVIFPMGMNPWDAVAEIKEGDDLSGIFSAEGTMTGEYEVHISGYWRFDTDRKVFKMLQAFFDVHGYKVVDFHKKFDYYWTMKIVKAI